MKKLLLTVALVASVSSLFADKVRLGSVTVAGRAALTESVNKLGELSCNMMLPGLLAGALADCPLETSEYAIFLDETCEPSCELITNKTAKLAKGVLVRLHVSGKGVQKIAQREELAKEMTDLQKKILRDFAAANAVLKLNDKGLTVEGEFKLVENSSLITECESGSPLKAEALAFAGKDCLAAGAATENGGADYRVVRQVLALLKKHGIDLSGFVTVGGGANDALMTLDPVAATKILPTLQDACEKFDKEKFEADLQTLETAETTLQTPAGKGSLALKGYESPFTPAERFEATLPDYAKKNFVQIGVWSYYAMIKAALATIAANATEASVKAQAKKISEVLPAELKGGCAMAMWDKSPSASAFVVRISADEIKSFGLASGPVMGVFMSGAMTLPDIDEDDDDDEEEDASVDED